MERVWQTPQLRGKQLQGNRILLLTREEGFPVRCLRLSKMMPRDKERGASIEQKCFHVVVIFQVQLHPRMVHNDAGENQYPPPPHLSGSISHLLLLMVTEFSDGKDLESHFHLRKKLALILHLHLPNLQ